MTKKKDHLIVFDWNGTLLADVSACLHAMNTVLKELGTPPITRKRYQKHYTMPLDKLYHAVGVDPAVLTAREDIIHPIFHKAYGASKICLRRGAKTMLQTIGNTPCSSIILSNYVADLIDQQAQRLGVREHFDEIIAYHVNNATFRRRSKGEHLEKYLKTRHAREGIIVGDTEEEIDIGRALGLVTIAITDGMCSTSRLRAMKPDFLIGTLAPIPSIAHRVFKSGKRNK